MLPNWMVFDSSSRVNKINARSAKVGCALFRFYISLIYRNAIKSKQDPCTKFRGKDLGLVALNEVSFAF